ncbi:hypothetical protein [Stenotrophomonas acidaminiphila]|jgi:hypothetical protein
MKVIAEEQWSYVLFEDREVGLITVLLGGVVNLDVTVQLTPSELSMARSDAKFAGELAASIRSNMENFREREVRPPVWPK